MRARALATINRLLGRVGLVVLELGPETAAERADRLTDGYLDAAGAAQAEVKRLRGHLVALDELLVGHSQATRVARRVLDVALGRLEESTA